MADDDALTLTIEFGGGLELLTAPPQPKRHTLRLPRRVSAPPTADDGSLAPAVTAPSAPDAAAEPPSPARPTMAYLIRWILANLIVERPELFADPAADTVRPGILVLINDADWELEGEDSYELEQGDHISFISTLHGG